jgi:putative MATE family efflux protein
MTKNHTTDLTTGTEWKVILKFAFPLLIGNILIQLYNITDSIIVGQYLGKEALAAVSASFFVYYFIISLVIGIGSGTSIVVSQLFGAKKYDDVQRAFSSFFIFMLIVGIVFSITGIIFAESIFKLIHTPPEIIPDAVSYFKIYIGGTFLFVTFNSILSILRGIGDSTRPMIFLLISTVLNIALDLLFIVYLDWGIEGAARATIIAQGIPMCLAMHYINNKHPILSIKKKDMLFDLALFKSELKIGIPTSIQQCAIALGLIALLGIVNNFGTNTLTAYGVGGRIEAIITQIILTLSGAITAFTAQNLGAGRLDRVRKGLIVGLKINALCSLTAFMLIYLWSKQMMLAFTNDPQVIQIGEDYLHIIGGFLIVNGAFNTYSGVLRGAGDTFFVMIISLLSLWILRIPLALTLSKYYHQDGIWWAISLSCTIALLVTFIYYQMGFWKKKTILQKE